jgi:hypothetical protein
VVSQSSLYDPTNEILRENQNIVCQHIFVDINVPVGAVMVPSAVVVVAKAAGELEKVNSTSDANELLFKRRLNGFPQLSMAQNNTSGRNVRMRS